MFGFGRDDDPTQQFLKLVELDREEEARARKRGEQRFVCSDKLLAKAYEAGYIPQDFGHYQDGEAIPTPEEALLADATAPDNELFLNLRLRWLGLTASDVEAVENGAKIADLERMPHVRQERFEPPRPGSSRPSLSADDFGKAPEPTYVKLAHIGAGVPRRSDFNFNE